MFFQLLLLQAVWIAPADPDHFACEWLEPTGPPRRAVVGDWGHRSEVSPFGFSRTARTSTWERRFKWGSVSTSMLAQTRRILR
jgi:hypothetical protein